MKTKSIINNINQISPEDIEVMEDMKETVVGISEKLMRFFEAGNYHQYQENKNEIDWMILRSDFNYKNQSGLTPMHMIITQNRDMGLYYSSGQIMDMLYKSDLNYQDNQGKNLLFYVIEHNDEQVLNISNQQIMDLMKKSDLTQKDNYGNNILMHFIAHKGFDEFNFSKRDAQFLIKNCDINDVNSYQQSVLMKMAGSSSPYNIKDETANSSSEYSLLDLFVEAGADINMVDNSQYSALHFSLFNNFFLTRKLIMMGAKVNMENIKSFCSSEHEIHSIEKWVAEYENNKIKETLVKVGGNKTKTL